MHNLGTADFVAFVHQMGLKTLENLCLSLQGLTHTGTRKKATVGAFGQRDRDTG